MAASTLTQRINWRESAELYEVCSHYQSLREKKKQISAVAFALGELLERNTYACDLADLLNELLSNEKSYYALDEYFGVDNNGDLVEVQHG